MILANFSEQNIERDDFCALSGQFIDDSAIDLPRPIKTKIVTKLAAFHDADGVFVNASEAEVCGDLRREMKRGASAPVVGHAFEALEEIQTADGGDGGEQDDSGSDVGWRMFERLEFHFGELNKKTRATQGRSGFLRSLMSYGLCLDTWPSLP